MVLVSELERGLVYDVTVKDYYTGQISEPQRVTFLKVFDVNNIKYLWVMRDTGNPFSIEIALITDLVAVGTD